MIWLQGRIARPRRSGVMLVGGRRRDDVAAVCRFSSVYQRKALGQSRMQIPYASHCESVSTEQTIILVLSGPLGIDTGLSTAFRGWQPWCRSLRLRSIAHGDEVYVVSYRVVTRSRASPDLQLPLARHPSVF